MSIPALIAVDWGTSSLRAYLLDYSGVVIEQAMAPYGVRALPVAATRIEAFGIALHSVAGNWLERFRGVPLLACGMVGSVSGWLEAPYARTPVTMAGLADLAVSVGYPNAAEMLVVPGVMHVANGSPVDVMRGEETQVFGALAQDACLASDSLMILPGTHSKWVRVHAGQILSFSTYLTGEMFAILLQHSILSELLRSASRSDEEIFREGVEAARQADGTSLLAQIFAVRTRVLAGKLSGENLHEYLSGVLIGNEVADGVRRWMPGDANSEQIVLVGELELLKRYANALEMLDVPTVVRLVNTAPAGLHALAGNLGLLHGVAA